MSQHKRYDKLTAAARAAITELTVEEIARGANVPKQLLIDVREESEWLTGHATSAVHLSRGIVEREIEAVAPDLTTPIVIYCATGERSALVAESLQRMGYTAVKSLAGGFHEWKKARLPTVPGGANKPL